MLLNNALSAVIYGKSMNYSKYLSRTSIYNNVHWLVQPLSDAVPLSSSTQKMLPVMVIIAV